MIETIVCTILICATVITCVYLMCQSTKEILLAGISTYKETTTPPETQIPDQIKAEINEIKSQLTGISLNKGIRKL